MSEYPISSLRFAPYKDSMHRLLSVGRESIRTWRISRGHLPGVSVRLHNMGRDQTFTDFAFEPQYGPVDVYQKRVFVSSSSGSVLQVNFDTSTLECLFNLHPHAVTAIACTEAFCITASADGVATVWKLDMSEFVMQVKQKGAVTSLQTSSDGRIVLLGGEGGAMGSLNLTTAKFSTISRAHTAAITCLAVDPHYQRSHVATGSADGCIRIWSITGLTSSPRLHADGMYSESYSVFKLFYEFLCTEPNEVVTSLCYSPAPHSHMLISGFSSGFVRVRDLGNPDLGTFDHVSVPAPNSSSIDCFLLLLLFRFVQMCACFYVLDHSFFLSDLVPCLSLGMRLSTFS